MGSGECPNDNFHANVVIGELIKCRLNRFMCFDFLCVRFGRSQATDISQSVEKSLQSVDSITLIALQVPVTPV